MKIQAEKWGEMLKTKGIGGNPAGKCKKWLKFG